jgi:hypothetical protein
MKAIDVGKSLMRSRIAEPAGVFRAEATHRSKGARVSGLHRRPSVRR